MSLSDGPGIVEGKTGKGGMESSGRHKQEILSVLPLPTACRRAAEAKRTTTK